LRTARCATVCRPRAWLRATIRADQRSRRETTCSGSGRWGCSDEHACLATERGRRERQNRSRPRTRALRVGGERSTGRAARGWGRRPVDSSSTWPVRITTDRLHAHALRRARSGPARGTRGGVLCLLWSLARDLQIEALPTDAGNDSRIGRTTATSGLWRGAGWCQAGSTRSKGDDDGVRQNCRLEYQDAARERARALPEREAFMCFEHVAMGPPVQSVIESIPAVRLHGPPQQASLTEPRADALRQGSDPFLTADSTWRHIS
jgi:hypothetical protein